MDSEQCDIYKVLPLIQQKPFCARHSARQGEAQGRGSEVRKHTALRGLQVSGALGVQRHGKQTRWLRPQGQESHCPEASPVPVRVVGRIQRDGPCMHPTLYTGLVNTSSRHHQAHGHSHYHFRQEPAHTVVICTLRNQGTPRRHRVSIQRAEPGWDGVRL